MGESGKREHDSKRKAIGRKRRSGGEGRARERESEKEWFFWEREYDQASE